MKNMNSYKIRLRAFVLALCLAVTSVQFVSNATAQSAANIEFLNPSNFSAVPAPPSPDPQVPRGPDTLIVSDLLTENPDTGDETYRLSAWVSSVPQNPAVEFELLTRGGVSILIIDEVIRVGADTFEADWDIPDSLPDGAYTLRATLAEGIIGVDSVDQDIVIQRVAERAEITYPDNRSGTGQYGMFAPLARSANADGQVVQPNPVGNIENRSTGAAPGSGPGRLRAFYTTSQPGTVPQWKVCGTESASGSWPFGGANNGVRCTLESPGDLPLLTGVALVANNTKANQPYSNSANQAGDATRVVEPYAQVPTKLTVVAGHTGTLDSGSCHEVIVELTDQFEREVLAANFDAQAWGPHDRLKFGTGLIDSWSAQSPDRGGHAEEAGMDCNFSGDDEQVGTQGEHQVIGGPDVKHVESDATGTDDVGQWGFQLFIPADSETAERHTTYWEVWLDETNDGSGVNNDVLDATEFCDAGLIGWGTAASNEPMTGVAPTCPNAPPIETCDPTTSSEPCPGATNSPSPTPTHGQEPPPEEDDRITIRASRKRVPKGKRVRFSGAIQAAADECEPGRQVMLQSRRPGRRFRTRVLSASRSDGSWSVTRRIRRTTEWRVVAQAVSDCDAVVSSVVKTRAVRRR